MIAKCSVLEELKSFLTYLSVNMFSEPRVCSQVLRAQNPNTCSTCIYLWFAVEKADATYFVIKLLFFLASTDDESVFVRYQ